MSQQIGNVWLIRGGLELVHRVMAIFQYRTSLGIFGDTVTHFSVNELGSNVSLLFVLIILEILKLDLYHKMLFLFLGN